MTATETERNQRWPLLSFRATAIAPQLRERVGQNATNPHLAEVARRDLSRYYAIMARDLPALNEGEWSLLCDVLNGTLLDETSIGYLWAEIADALDANPALADKWYVAGHALVDKLRRLTYGQLVAIADGVERFWRIAPSMETAEALRTARLVLDQ